VALHSVCGDPSRPVMLKTSFWGGIRVQLGLRAWSGADRIPSRPGGPRWSRLSSHNFQSHHAARARSDGKTGYLLEITTQLGSLHEILIQLNFEVAAICPIVFVIALITECRVTVYIELNSIFSLFHSMG
jgi:hypothetical protein